MDGPEPSWAPEAHLERVYRRGRQLRRRRMAIMLGPACGLVVVALVALGLQGSPSPGNHVRTVAKPETSTSSDQTGSGSTTVSTDPVDGASASTTSNTGARGVTRTTVKGRPKGASTTTAALGVVTSTTAPSAVSDCTASDLDYTTVTDNATYSRGEEVAVTLVARNRSNRPCNGPGFCGIGPSASIADSGGRTVWQSRPIAVACTSPPPPPPRLTPGQSYAYEAGSWDQLTCPGSGSCAQAPPGSYRAVAHRASTTAAATTFKLTG